MAETSGDLVRSAPPRVLEEILRLLRGGHALDSFQLLRDVGALKALRAGARRLPRPSPSTTRTRRLLAHCWTRSTTACSTAHALPNGVLLGALLVGPVLAKAARNPGRSASSVAEDVLGPLCAAAAPAASATPAA
jgi:tRNA nucleotidyltransferase/poly(A) polymerase